MGEGVGGFWAGDARGGMVMGGRDRGSWGGRDYLGGGGGGRGGRLRS